MDVQEIKWGQNSIDLVQDRGEWWIFVNTVTNIRVS